MPSRVGAECAPTDNSYGMLRCQLTRFHRVRGFEPQRCGITLTPEGQA
jgi:hypothetical protein